MNEFCNRRVYFYEENGKLMKNFFDEDNYKVYAHNIMRFMIEIINEFNKH